MLMNMRTQLVKGLEKKERGFTLTEIAIVLGIIGLILGAIWVAAAAVYNNMRTSKTTTELLDVAQNMRAMYATSGTVDPAANMNGFQNQNGAGLTYIQAGIFPADALVLNAATPPQGVGAQNPWNGYINVQATTGTAANDSFEISFDKVPQQACINIITSTTGTGRDPGLFSVQTGAAGAIPTVSAPPGTQNMPVTAANAQTLCANPTQSVGFAFKLK